VGARSKGGEGITENQTAMGCFIRIFLWERVDGMKKKNLRRRVGLKAQNEVWTAPVGENTMYAGNRNKISFPIGRQTGHHRQTKHGGRKLEECERHGIKKRFSPSGSKEG